MPPAAADSVRLPFLGQVQQKPETMNSARNHSESFKPHPTAESIPWSRDTCFSAACANEAHQIGEVAKAGGELVNARHGDARSALVEVGPAYGMYGPARRTACFCSLSLLACSILSPYALGLRPLECRAHEANAPQSFSHSEAIVGDQAPGDVGEALLPGPPKSALARTGRLPWENSPGAPGNAPLNTQSRPLKTLHP